MFIPQTVYSRGAEAYNSEDFEGTIREFEAALQEYLEEYERCELLCEGKYDHEAFPELFSALAGTIISFLQKRIFLVLHQSCFSPTPIMF